MVRRGIAGTAGAAHQKLLKLRDELGDTAECFAEAQAWDRWVWFTLKAERAVRGDGAPRLEDALRVASETDAADNSLLTHLALDLDNQDLGRQLERRACDAIAKHLRLLWAIRARHGRDL